MSILIFILILAALILVHEFGHFIVAKWNDIRVDEFGLGFPPKIFGYKPEGGETEYTLNWIPFGGFVKIFGEDYMEDGDVAEDDRSFINQPKWVQAAVLSAGVVFNVLFAWVLFSVGFMIGMPTAVGGAEDATQVENPKVIVTDVLDDSPAKEAGMQVGDEITQISNDETIGGDALSTQRIQEFIQAHPNTALNFNIDRQDETKQFTLTPEKGVVDSQPAVGIAMNTVGIMQLPPHTAIYQGLIFTGTKIKQVTFGLAGFFKRTVTGTADFSQVAGPVGIAGLVDEARSVGFVNLLSFIALISLNLAVLNLLPIPALDGGRLLFVGIEKVKGSRMKPKVVNALNTFGFALLILLMLVITYNDILRLFS